MARAFVSRQPVTLRLSLIHILLNDFVAGIDFPERSHAVKGIGDNYVLSAPRVH